MRFTRRAHGIAGRRGVSLIEILAGVTVLAMTVIAASALYPASAFLRDRSTGYAHAAAIVQRKLEQVRSYDPSVLTLSTLKTQNVVDTTSSGSGPWSFTTVDSVASELMQGTGTMSVVWDASSDLATVTVTVSWKDHRGMSNSTSAVTYVANKEVWKDTTGG